MRRDSPCKDNKSSNTVCKAVCNCFTSHQEAASQALPPSWAPGAVRYRLVVGVQRETPSCVPPAFSQPVEQGKKEAKRKRVQNCSRQEGGKPDGATDCKVTKTMHLRKTKGVPLYPLELWTLLFIFLLSHYKQPGITLTKMQMHFKVKYCKLFKLLY